MQLLLVPQNGIFKKDYLEQNGTIYKLLKNIVYYIRLSTYTLIQCCDIRNVIAQDFRRAQQLTMVRTRHTMASAMAADGDRSFTPLCSSCSCGGVVVVDLLVMFFSMVLLCVLRLTS